MDTYGLQPTIDRENLLTVLQNCIAKCDEEDSIKVLTTLQTRLKNGMIYVPQELVFESFIECISSYQKFVNINKWLFTIQENGFEISDIETWLDSRRAGFKDIGVIHRLLVAYDEMPKHRRYYVSSLVHAFKTLVCQGADKYRLNRHGLTVVDIIRGDSLLMMENLVDIINPRHRKSDCNDDFDNLFNFDTNDMYLKSNESKTNK